MMKTLVLSIALLCIATPALAQPSTQSSRLAWEQGGVATVQQAGAMMYKYYPDGSQIGHLLSNVVCQGTVEPFLCHADFPAFNPGPHSLYLTALNEAGESVPSSPPLMFTFVLIPNAPMNVRSVEVIGGKIQTK